MKVYAVKYPNVDSGEIETVSFYASGYNVGTVDSESGNGKHIGQALSPDDADLMALALASIVARVIGTIVREI